MRLSYLRESAVLELRQAIAFNESLYFRDAQWLEEFFHSRSFLAQSKLEVASLPALRSPANGELFELENAISLHSALNHLTPSQAADERLWTWLAHGPYWDYMRKRWPVEGQNYRSYVLEHFFLRDARSLVRHGLARLWWFGHSTHDVLSDDPYSLTRLLLKTTDARQSLLERTFWRNPQVLSAMLTRVSHWSEKGMDFYAPRERFRRLCKMFNVFGGTVLLDSLSRDQVFALVDEIATNEGVVQVDS